MYPQPAPALGVQLLPIVAFSLTSCEVVLLRLGKASRSRLGYFIGLGRLASCLRNCIVYCLHCRQKLLLLTFLSLFRPLSWRLYQLSMACLVQALQLSLRERRGPDNLTATVADREWAIAITTSGFRLGWQRV